MFGLVTASQIFADGLGVGSIVLLALDVWLDIGRRNQGRALWSRHVGPGYARAMPGTEVEESSTADIAEEFWGMVTLWNYPSVSRFTLGWRK
jgi:hypothetical protein